MLNEYSRVLQDDLDALQSFKLNFNSTFYSTDPYSIISAKILPVIKLLDLWEYQMCFLVARKKNLVDAVLRAVGLLTEELEQSMNEQTQATSNPV